MAGDVGKGKRQESIARRSGSAEEGTLYSEDELRFLQSVEEFKRRGKVRFPTHVDLFRLAKRHFEAVSSDASTTPIGE
ncbi:hypothetical protein [Limnoglobus roseus]|uniref:Uncharacterized protein n=1 Tax=Limnoglobus roseus TaxID=2598579 RepID=A0A5C1AK30_9BACT|nr:hypothetical protein [Limnoglobus roseus]QEL19230.1 hypothetical protein PX52LOC_06292 [Limnoglobus roseus]